MYRLRVEWLSVVSISSVGRGRWCNRCKVVHPASCPAAPVWVKPIQKRSGRGGRPWERKRKRVFERDNYLCQIHLQRDELVKVELHGVNAGFCDHIVPLAEGGSDDESNLQTICKYCDKIKTSIESLRGRGGSISKTLPGGDRSHNHFFARD